MNPKRGTLVGTKWHHHADRRDGLVEVTLEIHVRMTAAELKEHQDRVDARDLDATVTFGPESPT
jgi:hypothetical protein